MGPSQLIWDSHRYIVPAPTATSSWRRITKGDRLSPYQSEAKAQRWANFHTSVTVDIRQNRTTKLIVKLRVEWFNKMGQHPLQLSHADTPFPFLVLWNGGISLDPETRVFHFLIRNWISEKVDVGSYLQRLVLGRKDNQALIFIKSWNERCVHLEMSYCSLKGSRWHHFGCLWHQNTSQNTFRIRLLQYVWVLVALPLPINHWIFCALNKVNKEPFNKYWRLGKFSGPSNVVHWYTFSPTRTFWMSEDSLRTNCRWCASQSDFRKSNIAPSPQPGLPSSPQELNSFSR